MSKPGKDDTTITAKMAKLDEAVAWFDSEDFRLEAAMERFRDAERLAGEIEADLMAMKNEIEIVKRRFDEAE